MSRLIPALLICLITLSVVAYFPFGTDNQSLVGADGDTTTPLSLSVNSPITQSFLATGQPIKSLTFFSPLSQLGSRHLEVSLTDEQGHQLVHSDTVSTTVASNRLAIRFSLPQVDTYKEEPLRVALTQRAGEALPIIIRTDDSYPNGRLVTPPQPTSDVALSIGYPQANSTGFQEGIVWGVVLLLLTSILAPQLQRSWLPAGLLCVVLATALSLPFWFSTGRWGIDDWDYRFSLHETYRQALLNWHQFPWWNPYICGGTAGLADPEFSMLSITFIPELLFGVVTGIRISIWLSLVITSIGTLLLTRRLQFSPLAGWLAALTVTATSGVMLRLAEGHETIIFAFMWVPWVFASWIAAYRGSRPTWSSAVWPGLVLALIVYQGGIYMLSYLLLAFAVLVWLMTKPRRAIFTTVWAGAWAVGFSAFKLIPVLTWLKQFPDRDYVGSASTWQHLPDIFLGRYLHGSFVLPNQVSGWHEYGAYIGLGVLLLALIGTSEWFNSRLTRSLVIAAILTISLSASGPWLTHIFDKIPFIPRSNISRLSLLAVVPIALLAGQGVDRLRKRRAPLWVVATLIGLIAIDLVSLAYPIGEQGFVAQSVLPLVSPAPYPLGFTTATYPITVEDHDSPRAYAAILAGYSTYSFCSVLGPQGGVNPAAGQQPYVQTNQPTSSAKVTSWTPNKMTIAYQAYEPTQIVINSNFATGWRANNQPAVNVKGRVGTTIGPGQDIIVFQYVQPGKTVGFILTALTVAAAAILLVRQKRLA